MTQTPSFSSDRAQYAYLALRKRFNVLGLTTAIGSGIVYGLFTAFMTMAMHLGIWEQWTAQNSSLSPFLQIYLVGTLGSGVLCLWGALWSIFFLVYHGKFGDFLRCVWSFPGSIVLGVALAGGPIAMTLYVLGLQLAGSIIVPISALCTAIGALLGRILFKQPLGLRKALGVLICFLAGVLIGITGLGEEAAPQLMLGMTFGFLAAFAWGLEGCVGGYVSAILDTEIGNAIRQVTSALGTVLVLVPMFGMLGGLNLAETCGMVGAAFCDGPSFGWFMLAGFCAFLTYMMWYKGNSMCGAALGMACNGLFSFWGPFFCWILLGLIHGMDGYALPFLVWVGAIVMVLGIFVIAVNPLDYLPWRRKNA